MPLNDDQLLYTPPEEIEWDLVLLDSNIIESNITMPSETDTLINAGFTQGQLTSISGYEGGLKNQSELANLILKPTIKNFLSNYPSGINYIFHLANKKHSGASLQFLNTILSVQDYREYIGQTSSLQGLCKMLKTISVPVLQSMVIRSLDDLKFLCAQTASARPGYSLSQKKDVEYNDRHINQRNDSEVDHSSLLINAGFTQAQIDIVSNQERGSHYLDMLLELIKVKYDSYGYSFTELQIMINADFTINQIVSIVNQSVGEKNLFLLKSLLQPQCNETGNLLHDGSGMPITHLRLLQQIGFSTEDIIKVLNQDGGSKNIGQLINFLSSPHIYDFLSSNPSAAGSLCALAKCKYKGNHLQFLHKILSVEKYFDHIIQHSFFDRLCKSIKTYTAKNIMKKSVDSVENLAVLCGNILSTQPGLTQPGKKSERNGDSQQSINPAGTKKQRLSPYGFFEHNELDNPTYKVLEECGSICSGLI